MVSMVATFIHKKILSIRNTWILLFSKFQTEDTGKRKIEKGRQKNGQRQKEKAVVIKNKQKASNQGNKASNLKKKKKNVSRQRKKQKTNMSR